MRSKKIVFVNGSICPLNNTIPGQYIRVYYFVKSVSILVIAFIYYY